MLPTTLDGVWEDMPSWIERGANENAMQRHSLLSPIAEEDARGESETQRLTLAAESDAIAEEDARGEPVVQSLAPAAESDARGVVTTRRQSFMRTLVREHVSDTHRRSICAQGSKFDWRRIGDASPLAKFERMP